MVPAVAAGQAGVVFEFSFSNPGARSMGFGGAFVALADDATAAFANPAGLVQLTRPEISIDVRRWSYSTPFTHSGRFTGEPTGIGLDTETGIVTSRSENDLTGLSFLSFVYPKKKWSVAVYRHILANFATSSESQGIFLEGPGPADTFRLFDRQDQNDLEIVTYGLSGAFQVVESFSLGLGLTYFDGLIQGSQRQYRWDDESLASYFGMNSFLPERFVGGNSFVADDSDIGFAAGFLWHLGANWHLGGFFRQGAEFQLDIVAMGNQVSEDPNTPPGLEVEVSTPIATPDAYGAGIAYRSTSGRWTLSFEWDHIEYSAIFDSLTEVSEGEFIADGDEYRLGGEYAFLQSHPLLAIRAGVWRDPNHQVQSDRDSIIIQALVGEGEAQLHYAVGFGAAFEHFQVDLGIDLSDRQDMISVSGIYSW
jgi:long-subunit fatty acid transport protein